MNDYIKVTLLVKPGEGAEQKITEKLNEWFCEPPRDPPFPPGTLLHYGFQKDDA